MPPLIYSYIIISNAAFSDPSRTLSFAEADARADLLARLLQEKGVGPECIVVVMMPTSVENAIANLAIFKAGGAILPFYMNYTAVSFFLNVPLHFVRNLPSQLGLAPPTIVSLYA